MTEACNLTIAIDLLQQAQDLIDTLYKAGRNRDVFFEDNLCDVCQDFDNKVRYFLDATKTEKKED